MAMLVIYGTGVDRQDRDNWLLIYWGGGLLYQIPWLGFNVWCSQWLLLRLWVNGSVIDSLLVPMD